MNIVAWVLQGLLAAVFLFHARLSLMPPTRDRLNEGMWYILDMRRRCGCSPGSRKDWRRSV